MSSVALLINDLGPYAAKVQLLLMREFGCSFGQIRNALNLHAPVATKKLFDRIDASFTEKLPGVLDELTRLQCKWRAIQLLDGQVYSDAAVYYEITSDRLREMIVTRARSFEQQRRLGELEAGND